jgi:uncharacterized phosphosugar-binding protein
MKISPEQLNEFKQALQQIFLDAERASTLNQRSAPVYRSNAIDAVRRLANSTVEKYLDKK